MFDFALMCLALNVYHEARGEPIEGQVAVALSTVNRAKKNNADLCDVVFSKGQYSWTITGARNKVVLAAYLPKDKEAYSKALMVSKSALYMEDFTGGATSYHSLSVNPVWSKTMRYVGTWGNHRFYKEV